MFVQEYCYWIFVVCRIWFGLVLIHLPLTLDVKSSGHVPVVCCLVGDGDTGGGGTAFEGGGGVEEDCAGPTRVGGLDPLCYAGAGTQLLGGSVSSQTTQFVISIPSEFVLVWQHFIRPNPGKPPPFPKGVYPIGPFLTSANVSWIETKLQINKISNEWQSA